MKIKTNNIKATFRKRMLSTGLSALLTLSPVYIQAALETDPTEVITFVKTYCKGLDSSGNECTTALKKWVETGDSKTLSALALELTKTVRSPDSILSTYVATCLNAMSRTNFEAAAITYYTHSLDKALKTGKVPNRYLEAIKRSLTEKFSEALSSISIAVTILGSLASLLVALQTQQINGNALDDLKKAAQQNSKKYPTLTWHKLQSSIPEIRHELESNLAGQTKAINKIIDQLRNHCNYLEICERTGQKPKRSLVLHFYGTPGVGKSTALRIISEKLGIGVLTFGMPSAVEDNGKRANTVLARLMNPDVIDTRITKAYFKTPLRKAIENPGTMIIGFDEIEKMRKLDAQISKCDYRNDENYIAPSSLDEAMRDVKDQGMFAGFDVSDKIFVTISNETEESLNELEPSFRDRLMGSLVYFKQFGIEDYS